MKIEGLDGLIYKVINDVKPGTIDPGQRRNISCVVHGKDVKPSARVFPDTEWYICYSCGAYCDVVGLIMKINDVGFLEAIEIIKERYGIEIDVKRGVPKHTQIEHYAAFCEDMVKRTQHPRFNKIYFEIDKCIEEGNEEKLIKLSDFLTKFFQENQ